MSFTFDYEANAEKLAEFESFIDKEKSKKGSLMAILHKGQHLFGYLPIEVQQVISKKTRIPIAEIYGVVTFYSQFSLMPKGKHEIGVCLGTACYVRGAQSVLDEIKTELGIDVGQTTPDLNFSIEATRCIGACGLAPVMTISGDVYGKLKASEIKNILNSYRTEEVKK
ncbi:complex I 24 kDa subunit family protein [Miniphocaeibacter massiliensis]|uniref:NADH-quinone oxidoreductase subunit NuoE family protein n=1 Tax=Miniphocaeibacter massiliensis TaxID=2041841 RepID=UPI000C1C0391|nr:NAD(P)H-dependent oxidoreductase subunit E [Miniphocaeibacter massiliensis]